MAGRKALDSHSVAVANEKLWTDHPKLRDKRLTMDPEHAEYRREWLKAYKQAVQDRHARPPTSGKSKVGQAAVSCPGTTNTDLGVLVTRRHDGKVIPGARVSIVGRDRRNGTTNQDGMVTFRCVVPGAYTIIASKPHHRMEKISAQVPAGMSMFYALSLVAESKLTVIVTRQSDARPVYRAMVTVKTLASTHGTTTDRAGVALFRGLKPGTYTVRGSKKGYGPADGKVTIKESQEAALRLVLADAPAGTETVFYWYDKWGRDGGAAAGISAAYVEQVFFLPDMDAKIPIAEGPTPQTSWKGYHAGKHGVFERFQNLKGESVNMGELFYDEKYRWVRDEWKHSNHQLKYVTEAQAKEILNKTFDRYPPGKYANNIDDLSGVFKSEQFTQDIAKQYAKYGKSPKATIWQGRYVYMKDGKPTGKLGELQTNVDFEAHGNRWRLAVDAKTGRALNFFRLDELPAGTKARMQFEEVVIKWKGKITNVQQFTEGPMTVEISASWKGIMLEGMKSGAKSGGICGAFLGAISGFRKGGIPGALKGFALGGLTGAAFGAATGGVVSLASRLWPWAGRVAKVGGAVLTFLIIMLERKDTGLDPEEFHHPGKTDDDGNVWYVRNVHKEGFWFPKYDPHGMKIVCTDGTILEFGDEAVWQCSYKTTVIRAFNNDQDHVRWHMARTPEGSSTWWWYNMGTKEEHILTFRDDKAMENAIKRRAEEKAYRFQRTRN